MREKNELEWGRIKIQNSPYHSQVELILTGKEKPKNKKNSLFEKSSEDRNQRNEWRLDFF